MGWLDGLTGGGSEEPKAPDVPEIPHDEFHHGQYDDWAGNGIKAYHKELAAALSDRQAGPRYRQAMYDTIAAQQRSAEQGIRDQGAMAYGVNNPSGMTGALIAAQRAKAPYASADLAAREAGKQSMYNAGQGIENLKQQHANWYSTVNGPFLQNKSIETGAATSLASLAAGGTGAVGGSSGASGLAGGLSAVSSIVSILAMTGVI